MSAPIPRSSISTIWGGSPNTALSAISAAAGAPRPSSAGCALVYERRGRACLCRTVPLWISRSAEPWLASACDCIGPNAPSVRPGARKPIPAPAPMPVSRLAALHHFIKQPPKAPDRVYPAVKNREDDRVHDWEDRAGRSDHVGAARRRWSAEEKAAIVRETVAPGMSVSLVARRYGIAPNQVFTWRASTLACAVGHRRRAAGWAPSPRPRRPASVPATPARTGNRCRWPG